jgi:predicted transglutaminase-like cysteine proteinase
MAENPTQRPRPRRISLRSFIGRLGCFAAPHPALISLTAAAILIGVSMLVAPTGSLAGAAAGTLLAAIPPSEWTVADPGPRPSFFNSIEMRAGNLAPFRKWQGALARDASERQKSGTGACASGDQRECAYSEWERFLDRLRGRDRWYQLTAVNHEMNKRPYVTDADNWGVEDYWESPGEFFARSGDCEDYAIAKFLSLKRLGWSDESMRLVALQDLNLNSVGHAVLVVDYGGKTWLLDNQMQQVTETARVQHYRPVFSINESFWWHHRPRG